jgi:arachidonate 5-lipoxygenase
VLGEESVPDAADARPLLDLIDKEVWRRADKGAGAAARVLHSKAHACAKAKFIVREELHPDHRTGVFSHPGRTMNAYLRFSNGAGAFNPDSSADVRGFAIKVTDVEDVPATRGGNKRLVPDGPEKRTQDFVLLSTPQFFTGRVDRYAELLGATLSTTGLLQYVFNSWNPLRWTVTPLVNAIRMARASAGMVNPLAWTYFSTTPYRYGVSRHAAAKYRARPCRPDTEAYKKRAEADYARRSAGEDPNFLRSAMRSQLLEDGACFELDVLLQTDACKQPLDDPTIVWDGQWTTVATILIEKQEPLRRDFQAFCEAMSFTPWHGFEDHRPLGAVNRARLAAYMHGARARRAINERTQGIPRPQEPTGKEVFTGEAPPNPHEGAGNTKAWGYKAYPVPSQTLPRQLEKFPATGVLDNLKALVFGLPKDEPQQFDLPKATRIALYAFEEILTKLRYESGAGKPFAEWKTPQDYDEFFDKNAVRKDHKITGLLPIPDIARDGVWATDAGFGWQFIRGLNPMKLCNVSALGYPASLDLSPARVRDIERLALGGKDTLKGLLRANALFSVDYPELEGLPTEPGRIVYAPVALFRRRGRDLVPIVIQLTRLDTTKSGSTTTGKDGAPRQFYPSSHPSWMFAKMLLGNSDAIQHEMSSHLMGTHLAMEPIVIGFHRQLPDTHPVRRLMQQHFRQTIAINNLGRQTLLSPTNSIIGNVVGAGITGGLQLMANDYARWNFTAKSFRNDLRERGFAIDGFEAGTDADPLPGFFFRDDGLLVFGAMERYIRAALVGAGYGAEGAVRGDQLLQRLIRELADPLAGNVRGLPPLDTLDDLVFFLSSVMWLGTAQHSAVNFGQYDFLAFSPNRPLLLTRGMPVDPATVDDAYIMSALPNYDKLTATIQIIRIISLPPKYTLGKDGVAGPSLRDGVNTEFPEAFAAFQRELDAIDRSIDARNNRWQSGYRYLKPSEIAGSIAI